MGRPRRSLYNVWSHMRKRCYDKENIRYKYYGGRGIIVCDEWNANFNSFYEWAISNGYQKGLSIDRIDNDGPYAPWNCRWVDRFVQANNKRNNINVTFNGETKTLKQWANEYGIGYKLLQERYRRYHWDFERALTTPAEDWNVTIDGETHCVAEWARIKGIKVGTIFARVKYGWSKEEAITKPVRKIKKRDG